MLYRKDKYGNDISQLGFGCMRFTKKGGKFDAEKAEKEILRAIELGVNYFDTAYIYSGSEELLGNTMEKYGLRDKIYVATKLPQYSMKTINAIEKTFQEELRRLKTDHVDYYLMHMFTDIAEWNNLKEIGIEEWINSHKEDGSIRQIGFSYHGDSEMFIELLSAYDWDMCQIQYNYMDKHSQAGEKGLNAAYEKGIPVVIMEPLRGGKLVNIPDEAKKIMEDSGKGRTPAEWGLRWLWDQPGVTCILSGMNSLEMVEENARVASEAAVGEFTAEDFEVIDKVAAIIKSKEKVGCTGCRYCMPCPKGVDIPGAFHYYNLMYTISKRNGRLEYARNVGLRENPGYATLCIKCGKCEQHCPQHIEIRKELEIADKELRPFIYRHGVPIVSRYMMKKKK